MIYYCMQYLTRQNVLPIDLDIFISIASSLLVEETWSRYERCYIQLDLKLDLNYHWRIQGSGPGGPGSPLIFRPNWGVKGWKVIFGDLPSLPSPLSQGLDPALITTCIYWHGYWQDQDSWTGLYWNEERRTGRNPGSKGTKGNLNPSPVSIFIAYSPFFYFAVPMRATHSLFSNTFVDGLDSFTLHNLAHPR